MYKENILYANKSIIKINLIFDKRTFPFISVACMCVYNENQIHFFPIYII